MADDAEVPPEEEEWALAPALASNDIIKYSTATGQKLWIRATASLDTKYDGDAQGLKLFLTELAIRSCFSGWEEVLKVPPDLDDIYDTIHLINEYGRLTLEEVRAHAETYVTTHSRAAQDSIQLFNCLMATLSAAGKTKVMLKASQYTVKGIFSGPCLLKLVISLAHIDTNATTRQIRDKLSSLDSYMTTTNSDITKFNAYVDNLTNSLSARGETTKDLLTNLFKGYRAATDRTFVEYITKKEDDYDEGREVEPIVLMDLAENKYKKMVEEGRWNAPSDSDAKIIALKAELDKLKKAKGKNPGAKPTVKPDEGKKPRREKPAWMLKAPIDSQPKEKTVDTKKYYWCPAHASWVMHKPSECRGTSYKGPPPKAPQAAAGAAKKPPAAATNKALSLARSLAALVEQESEESS
jgi:hypothetical protein